MGRYLISLILAGMIIFCVSCTEPQTVVEQDLQTTTAPPVPTPAAPAPLATLITLDPGHFHAALVQKSMYPQIAETVYVYAPQGDELAAHLKLIDSYNSRAENPTHWTQEVYTGPDFAARAFSEKKGNVLVLAGDNRKKIEYIKAGVEAKLNVFSDKPMCIDAAGYDLLQEAFKTARQNNVLLYDIMTERYEITTILQKELAHMPELFGELKTGSADDPAIVKESVHHFFKIVSGSPLKRPPWFFDTDRQGEGIVDVTTHLVDLVLWEAFPEQPIAVEDTEVLAAGRWPTVLTPQQFQQVTQTSDFPPSLKGRLNNDGMLPCYANGQIDFTVLGIHARVKVEWNYQAPEGAGDTHYSIMKGTRANLVIRQGKEENYRPELYVVPAEGLTVDDLSGSVFKATLNLQRTRPGVLGHKEGDRWHIIIPDRYRVGHEAHFAQVTEKYLAFLREGKLPEWEISNMLTKYYITTAALEKARSQ
jgi:predicted dehydrogenase